MSSMAVISVFEKLGAQWSSFIACIYFLCDFMCDSLLTSQVAVIVSSG